MPTSSQSLVIYAKDKARVSAFYRETLGLTAEEDQPSHDLLTGPGIDIVVHTVPPAYSADIHIAIENILRA